MDPDRLGHHRPSPGAVHGVWASAATTVEPNTTNREVYDRLYTIYGELYPATRSQAHALAALQAEEGLVPTEP